MANRHLTPDEVRALLFAFAMRDPGGTGTLSAGRSTQLAMRLGRCSEDEAFAWFLEADADSDAVVDVIEYLEALGREKQRASSRFAAFLRSAENLAAGLGLPALEVARRREEDEAHRLYLSPDQALRAARFFDAIDTDADGLVSRDEFADACRRSKFANKPRARELFDSAAKELYHSHMTLLDFLVLVRDEIKHRGRGPLLRASIALMRCNEVAHYCLETALEEDYDRLDLGHLLDFEGFRDLLTRLEWEGTYDLALAKHREYSKGGIGLDPDGLRDLLNDPAVRRHFPDDVTDGAPDAKADLESIAPAHGGDATLGYQLGEAAAVAAVATLANEVGEVVATHGASPLLAAYFTELLAGVATVVLANLILPAVVVGFALVGVAATRRRFLDDGDSTR